MLSNICRVECLCGVILFMVCAKAGTTYEVAEAQHRYNVVHHAPPQQDLAGDADSRDNDDWTPPSPVHIILYKKTRFKARSYCSNLCQGCTALHRGALQSYDRWLNLSHSEFWLYDNEKDNAMFPGTCVVVSRPYKELQTTIVDCLSKQKFICILPSKGTPCQSSLVVFPSGVHPPPKPDACGRLLNAHNVEDRQCAAMHGNLSFGWWSATTNQNETNGSQCHAATISTSGYVVTPWACNLLFPFMCFQNDKPKQPEKVKSKVKCYYFGDPPVGTYCQVVAPAEANSALEAEGQCRALDMTLLNMSDITLHRLCLLMDRNHFNKTKIWIADMPENAQPLQDCGLERLNDNVVQNGTTSCDTCGIHVVCEASFHQASSTCAIVEGTSGPMEYCYHKAPEPFAVSEGICKTVSKSLLNESSMDEPGLIQHLGAIVHSDLEYWVDLGDVRQGDLSAVVAYRSYSSTATTNLCTAVWLGRKVPWVFQRQCTERLPIICQGESYKPYPDQQNDICRYHNGSDVSLCVPKRGRFNITEAHEFCKERGMTLLLGSSLTFLGMFDGSGVVANVQDGNLWITDGSGEVQCSVASLTNRGKGKEDCTKSHSYICMGKPQEHLKKCKGCIQNGCSFCVGGSDLSSQGSIQQCQEYRLSLLPTGRDEDYYRKAFSVLSPGYSEVTEVWVQPRTSDGGCVSMYIQNGTFYERLLNCSLRLQYICTSILPPSTTSTEAGTLGKRCHSEKHNGIRWPETEATRSAEVYCATDEEALLRTTDPWARRECDADGNWEPFPDTTRCSSASVQNELKKLEGLNDIKAIGDLLTTASEQVEFGGDLTDLANAAKEKLQNIKELLNSSSSESLASDMVVITENTMKNQDAWRGLRQEERLKTATVYLENVETTLKIMIKHNADRKDIILTRNNITVEVAKRDPRFPVLLPENRKGSSVSLPPNFSLENEVHVIYAEYPSLGTLLNDMKSESNTNKYQVGTPVVTVTALDSKQKPLNELKRNVSLTFKNLYGQDSLQLALQCAYLTFENETKWETSNCSVVTWNSTAVECTCNHLTNFAVLMSPHSDQTTVALDLITYIGCGISIVCLSLCVVVFTSFRQLRGIRNTIHRNLCISLLLAEVLMVIGMDRQHGWMKIEWDGAHGMVLCTVVACTLHFLFLSAFFWMALEGCHIIVLLWKVFNSKRTYYERYYFVGYGIPLIIVSVTVGIGYKSYMMENRLCWVPKENHLRLSFIVPVLLIIALNIGALCLVLWKMARLKQAADKSTAEKVRNWVRGTFILLPLLGVTWLLGLALWEDTVGVLAYAFTILNSLQGLGIFVCHVLMSKKVRDVVLNSLRKSTRRIMKGSQMSRSSRSSTGTVWYRLSSSTPSSTQSSTTTADHLHKRKTRPSSSVESMESDSPTCKDCWGPSKFKYQFNLNTEEALDASKAKSSRGSGNVVLFRHAASDC